MVNTLRIASVAAVILAGLLLASVMGFASLRTLDPTQDDDLSRILGSPSVVDTFRERQGDQAQSRQDAISPLDREAEKFALYLNPPPPPQPDRPAAAPTRVSRPTPTPQTTSARFDLLGISHSPASQNDSFAYIRMQDGQTHRWVRVGDEIGHMQIREIRRDSIVCWDGNKDVSMALPERFSASSSLEATVSSTTSTGRPDVVPSASERITASSQTEGASRPLLSPTGEQERASLGGLIDKIRESAGSERQVMVDRLREQLSGTRQKAQPTE